MLLLPMFIINDIKYIRYNEIIRYFSSFGKSSRFIDIKESKFKHFQIISFK
jgi:hypothetical protein